jgi:hypothetical protein
MSAGGRSYALITARQSVNLLQEARKHLAGLPEDVCECFLKYIYMRTAIDGWPICSSK